jgi:hypothetical protein
VVADAGANGRVRNLEQERVAGGVEQAQVAEALPDERVGAEDDLVDLLVCRENGLSGTTDT